MAEDSDAGFVGPVVENATDLVNESACIMRIRWSVRARLSTAWLGVDTYSLCEDGGSPCQERTFDWLLMEEAGYLPPNRAHDTIYICVNSLFGLVF